MTDNLMSKIVHKFLSATSKILGKMFRNVLIDGSIVAFGFFLSTSNIVTFVLFTIYMFLNTIDVWTGKFSHKKVVFDNVNIATSGFFVLILFIWFGYFSFENHGGIGTPDFMKPFSEKVVCFIFYECAFIIVLLILWLLMKYILPALKKLWDYLNRWQK